MDAGICEFVNRLVFHVKNEHVFKQITEEWRQNKTKYKGRWDTPARFWIVYCVYNNLKPHGFWT